jgi:arylsulfatase
LGRSQGFINWYQYEFWRFVLVQQIVGQYAQTFIDYPPMQKGASFNLEQLKASGGATMSSRKNAPDRSTFSS